MAVADDESIAVLRASGGVDMVGIDAAAGTAETAYQCAGLFDRGRIFISPLWIAAVF